MAPSKLEQFSKIINVDRVLEYISTRRHEDGGYCFVSALDETNINDTYYAIKSYLVLGLEVPEKEKTIEFLYKAAQMQTAAVGVAMAIEGLAILGAREMAIEKVELLLKKYNPLEGKFAVGLGGSEEFGTATPLEATYWAVRAFKYSGYEVDDEIKDRIREFVMRYRMGDSYGVRHPTTTMTYQAIYSLRNLGYKPPRSSHFRKVEVCSWGGFTEVPYSLPPYLEPTFYAIRGLRLQSETPSCLKPHLRFIKTLQNPNGGFRRSIEMGISNFQNTYRALASLSVLLEWSQWT